MVEAGHTKMMNDILPQLEKKTGNFKIRDEPFSDSYIIDEEIGRGKFAKVKKCRHKDNGVVYAAKFLRKRRKGEDCRNEILHEVAMLQRALEHPRLIHLVDVYETTQEVILVTEFAAGGELFQHFVHEECFEEKDVVRLMRQILDGLSFLHENSIVHLDVKPQNILLTDPLPKGDIKLCDFGFARLVNSGEDIRDILGTPDYVAPEVLNYEPIKTASDMWSVGVLAYVMLTGCSPFAGDTKQETFLNISQVNVDFPDELFANISANAKDFVSRLLVSNPSDRLKAHECLKHSWLRTSQPNPKSTTTPATSPIGSPVGCRRAHSPPSPEKSTEFEAHSKKYKLDTEATVLNGTAAEDRIITTSCYGVTEATSCYGVTEGKCVKTAVTVNSISDTQLAC